MTTKTIITPTISTALTTAYTNNTTTGAVLKSINLNGVGDPTKFVAATGATESSFFGSSINPLTQISQQGFGIPFPVQLTADRVLLISLPHFQHMGGTLDYMGGNTIHTQVVEYTGEKYINYPIVNVALPTAEFTAAATGLFTTRCSPGYGQPVIKAVALSPTVVVVAYRCAGVTNAFRLMRININGNTVDQTSVVDLDLTGVLYFNTSASTLLFDIALVPGDTTKVLVGGQGATQYSVQAFNIPASGALSSASNLFSLGVANSTYGFSFDTIVGAATSNTSVYCVAASTAATTFAALLFSYNSATTTENLKFTLTGTAITITTPNVDAINGLNVAGISTDTNANGVIGLAAQTGNTSFFTYRQTSLTQVMTVVVTTALQHATQKNLQRSFKWGPNKIVFMGDTGLLVAYDNAGTVTNLLPATETTNADRYQQQWIPFNTRPLYNLYDPQNVLTSRVPQWYSRTTNITTVSAVATGGTATLTYLTQPTIPFAVGQTIIVSGVTPTAFNGTFVVTGTPSTTQVQFALTETYGPQTVAGNINGVLSTSTKVGTTEFKKTYFPYGHNYGGNYAWNEQAQCWIVAAYGRIYALGTTGTVLDEISLYDIDPTAANSQTATSNIKQLHVTPSGKIVFVTELHNGTHPSYACNNQWNGLTNQIYGFALNPLLNNSPTALSRATRLGTADVNIAGFLTCNLAPVLDGSDAMYLLYMKVIATPNTSIAKFDGTVWSTLVPTSVGTTTAGSWNVGYRPNLKLIQDSVALGTWRIFGSQGTNTLAQYQSLGISPTPYKEVSFGSLTTTKAFVANSTHINGYSITFGTSNNIHAVSSYDETLGGTRVFWTANGLSMTTPVAGGYALVNSNLKYATMATTRYGFTVGVNNTSTGQAAPTALVFDAVTRDVPKYTFVGTLGSGQITTYPTGKLSWQTYGAGIDKIYTVSGWNDTAKAYITINNGTSNFYLTSQLGQLLSTNINSNFRSTDSYLIPPTYSVQIMTDSPNSVSSMLTIVEEG